MPYERRINRKGCQILRFSLECSARNYVLYYVLYRSVYQRIHYEYRI